MQISRIQTTPIQRKQAPQTNFKGITCAKIKAGDEILDGYIENVSSNLLFQNGAEVKISLHDGITTLGANLSEKYSEFEALLRNGLNEIKQAYPKETQIITADSPNARLADEMKKLAEPKKTPRTNLGTIISLKLTGLDNTGNDILRLFCNSIINAVKYKTLVNGFCDIHNDADMIPYELSSFPRKSADIELNMSEGTKTLAIQTHKKISKQQELELKNYLNPFKDEAIPESLEFRISNDINATLEDEMRQLPN